MEKFMFVDARIFVYDTGKMDVNGNSIWATPFTSLLVRSEIEGQYNDKIWLLRKAEQRAKTLGLRKTKNGMVYTFQKVRLYSGLQNQLTGLINEIEAEERKNGFMK